MNATLLKPPTSNLTKAIVFMEDDPFTLDKYKQFYKALEWNVYTASNWKDAVRFSEIGISSCFLLDMSMGSGRGSEGLIALEAIRKSNFSTCIVIVSNGLDLKTQEKVDYLGGIFIRKVSSDPDVSAQRAYKYMKNHMQNISQQKMDESSTGFDKQPNFALMHQKNKDFLASLIANDDWFSANKNLYVAVSGGTVIKISPNKADVLNYLRDSIPPDRAVYVTQVRREPKTIKLPSSLRKAYK
jgi:response regulator RpfG family c-di-GMP phosphodiesterase